MNRPAMIRINTGDPDHAIMVQDIQIEEGRFRHCRGWGLRLVSDGESDAPMITLQMRDPAHAGYGLHTFMAPHTARGLAAQLIRMADAVERHARDAADAALKKAAGK